MTSTGTSVGPSGRTRRTADVVPVEGHVEGADRHLDALEGGDGGGQALGHRDAPGVEPDQHDVVGAVVALDDLVGDAGDGPLQVVGLEDPGPEKPMPLTRRVRGAPSRLFAQVVRLRGDLTGSPSRLPLGRYHDRGGSGTPTTSRRTGTTTSGPVATLRDMTHRRAVIAVVLAALVLSGCGAAEKLSPRVAVREAAQSTANQKEGSFRLSLVGSEADMNTLLNEGAPLSEEDRQGLETLRNSHLTFSTGDDKFGLDVKVGELDHAVEFRMIAGKLYARADVAALAKLFSGSSEAFDRGVAGLASKEGFGFITAAATGKWIVADFSTLRGLFEDLGKQFTGGSGRFPNYLACLAALGAFAFAVIRI